MIKEIRVNKPFSIKILKPIADNEKIQPTPQLDYETYYVVEEKKSNSLPPKNFEILIPFIGSPKKVKFKCPNCNKEFITMVNGSKDKTYIECEIKFCSNCGQEFNWRIDNETA